MISPTGKAAPSSIPTVSSRPGTNLSIITSLSKWPALAIAAANCRAPPAMTRPIGGSKQPLRQVLVHRDGARDVIAARVGDTRQVEHALDTTVFTGASVKGQKHDV